MNDIIELLENSNSLVNNSRSSFSNKNNLIYLESKENFNDPRNQ